MSELQVPDDFIEENKNNLGQFMPKYRARGPYTKQEKENRRNEVHKLHFEYGYSARKIAEMLKVNRNTINSDISFLYSTLGSEYKTEQIDGWLYKQLYRMESQRARLRKEIDSEISLQEKLPIEKMLSDLDSKISNLIIRIRTSRISINDFAVEFINDWMKEHNYRDRYMLSSSLYRIPEKSKEKIFQLLKTK